MLRRTRVIEKAALRVYAVRAIRGCRMLTVNQVDYRLKHNSHTVHIDGQENFGKSPIICYETNQLAANQPIEDYRAESVLRTAHGMPTSYFFGVFDGHGGPSCAKQVSSHLYDLITANLYASDAKQAPDDFTPSDLPIPLRMGVQQHVERSSGFLEMLRSTAEMKQVGMSYSDAIVRSFDQLDARISEEAFEGLKQGDLPDLDVLKAAFSGCVTTMGIVDDRDLYIAHLGDCAAVIGRCENEDHALTQVIRRGSGGGDVHALLNASAGEGQEASAKANLSAVTSRVLASWTAQKLTAEHNTSNTSEVTRIRKAHAAHEASTVFKNEKLLGILSPLRAFGDVQLKWSNERLQVAANWRERERTRSGVRVLKWLPTPAHGYHSPPYLISQPQVSRVRLTPADRFLLIASDGFWDFVSPETAVKLVASYLLNKAVLATDFRFAHERLDRLVQTLRVLARISATLDNSAATFLLRHALGGVNMDADKQYAKLQALLSLPKPLARQYRDDITVTIVYFNPSYLADES